MVLATTDFGLKLAFLIGFAVVFGGVILVPWMFDLRHSHLSRSEGEEPKGTPGLSRASMALSVIVVIGFALTYLLMLTPLTNNGKPVGDILVALTTTLAAIVAFYFGSKLAQEATAGTATTSAAPVPAITVSRPGEGAKYKAGAHVKPSFSATGVYDHILTNATNGGIDTTAGEHVFVVSARDADDHELAAKAVHYRVV